MYKYCVNINAGVEKQNKGEGKAGVGSVEMNLQQNALGLKKLLFFNIQCSSVCCWHVLYFSFNQFNKVLIKSSHMY